MLTDAFNHMLAQIEEQNAQLERRVLERTAELEAANDELEAFCSSAAHDLRTPLRAIAGFAEVLLDRRADDLPPDAKRYIGLIHAGSGQMGQLIQDLLSFSRLGRQEISRQSVPLEQLCRDALRDFEAEPALRRARISIGPLPTVFADAALLRVVFLVPLTAGAMIAFSIRTDLQDGHDRCPLLDWLSKAPLSRNHPSNSCPLWQRSEYAITGTLHVSLPPGCLHRMGRALTIR